MTASRPLVHALYTNAAGIGKRAAGLGFRLLTVPCDALENWSVEDRRRLQRFLVGLSPIRDDRAAVAAHCLRLGSTLRACLVRSIPGVARDAHGRRGGRLLHAILVPVEEWKDRCVHHQALVTAGAPGGEMGADVDLDGYLEACRLADAVLLQPLDTAVLGALLREARPVVAAFLAATMAQDEQPELAVPVPARQLPELLSGAAAALPPRLRLAARWAIGFKQGAGSFIFARAVEAANLPASLPTVSAYLGRLEAILGTGRTRIAEGWLHDWQIRSWDELTRRSQEEVD